MPLRPSTRWLPASSFCLAKTRSRSFDVRKDLSLLLGSVVQARVAPQRRCKCDYFDLLSRSPFVMPPRDSIAACSESPAQQNLAIPSLPAFADLRVSHPPAQKWL